MYANTITESMRKVIDETKRHRDIQTKYNEEHHITPKQIRKATGANELVTRADRHGEKVEMVKSSLRVAEDVELYSTESDIRKAIELTRKEMVEAAHRMDFENAALLRDKIIELEKVLSKKAKNKK